MEHCCSNFIPSNINRGDRRKERNIDKKKERELKRLKERDIREERERVDKQAAVRHVLGLCGEYPPPIIL